MVTWAVLTGSGIVTIDADYCFIKDGRQLCLQNKGEQHPIAMFNDWLHVTEDTSGQPVEKVIEVKCCE